MKFQDKRWRAVRGRMIVAVVTLVLFTPMPSQATTLVEGGNTTYDPSTGLRWLDVGITTGRSYNDVLSNLNNPSDVVYGYRFATGNEIGQLFIDAGLYEFPYGGGFCDPCSDALSNSEISHLITLLGPTFSSEIGQPNLQYILGFNADIYQSSYQYLSLLAYYAPTYALAIVPKDFLSPNSSRSDIGSFLVEVSPTPLPATLPLFATGLSVMGLLIADRLCRRIKLLSQLLRCAVRPYQLYHLPAELRRIAWVFPCHRGLRKLK